MDEPDFLADFAGQFFFPGACKKTLFEAIALGSRIALQR
jgi:hypothetical protein